MGIAIDSYVGKRKTNEDYIKIFQNDSDQILAVLADGMGGHNGGGIASEMAVSHLGYKWEKGQIDSDEDLKKWFKKEINEENNRIYKAGATYDDLSGMGTTLVACAIVNGKIVIANVGDSRAYAYNDFEINLLTLDHSYANELYLKGEITRLEAERHQQRNTLTRSLGVSNQVDVDLFEINAEDVNYIFLCSDGLSNSLDEEEMVVHLMSDLSTKDKAKSMVQNAFNNGSTDNISIVLLDIEKIVRGGE